MRKRDNELVLRVRAITLTLQFPIRCTLLVLLLLSIRGACAQTTDDSAPSIIAALRAQQFDQALRLLQPALERSPNDPRLWSLQGVALSAEGRKKEALAAYHHALSIA